MLYVHIIQIEIIQKKKETQIKYQKTINPLLSAIIHNIKYAI